MSLKITFGMCILNGGFFLKQVLDAIYPFAHAICIAEGPVEWWHKQGVKYSTDGTIHIIANYPDPEKKIHYFMNNDDPSGFYIEKTEQCQSWFQFVPGDTDYVFCVDADEIHKPEDIEMLIKFLESEQPTSVGFRSNTFFGGFDHIMGGFERDHSFKRVLKYVKGCHYHTHRQPTLAVGDKIIDGNDISGRILYNAIGYEMYHYSYVSPRQVNDKIRYYEGAVIAPGKCISNYMSQVFLPWCFQPGLREGIEQKFRGVHEFTPDIRGDAFTEPFTSTHPEVILKDLERLKQNFQRELNSFKWTQPNLF